MVSAAKSQHATVMYTRQGNTILLHSTIPKGTLTAQFHTLVLVLCATVLAFPETVLFLRINCSFAPIAVDEVVVAPRSCRQQRCLRPPFECLRLHSIQYFTYFKMNHTYLGILRVRIDEAMATIKGRSRLRTGDHDGEWSSAIRCACWRSVGRSCTVGPNNAPSSVARTTTRSKPKRIPSSSLLCLFFMRLSVSSNDFYFGQLVSFVRVWGSISGAANIGMAYRLLVNAKKQFYNVWPSYGRANELFDPLY